MTDLPSVSSRSTVLDRNLRTPRAINDLVLQSPMKSCAICLEVIKDGARCYAYACFHQFCLDCLTKWCEQKPECPLCKRKLRSIIHNVKSAQDFVTLKLKDVSYCPHSEHISDAMYELFRDETTQIQMFELMYMADIFPSRQENGGISWRNYVYKRQLYAVPSTIEYSFDLNSTVDYYRQNEAIFECLCNWLEREIHANFQENSEMDETSVWRTLRSIIQNHDLGSSVCEHLIVVLVGRFVEAKHFLHELRSFAKSPYNSDIIAYDEMVAYDPHLPTSFPLSPFTFGSPLIFTPENNRYYNRRRTPDYLSTPTSTRLFPRVNALPSRRLFEHASTSQPASASSYDFNSPSSNQTGTVFATPENVIHSDDNFGRSSNLSTPTLNHSTTESYTPSGDPFTFYSRSMKLKSSGNSTASMPPSPFLHNTELLGANNNGQHSPNIDRVRYSSSTVIVSGITPLNP